jgi:hypothetical protein
MKLIIDRCSTKRFIYSFGLGPDYDILVGQWNIPFVKCKETMSEIDRLITNSIDLKFCVLNLKHPLLIESNNSLEKFGHDYKPILREYFALRLIHRRFSVELIEVGKRLFDI